jgi:hypothetical protein
VPTPVSVCSHPSHASTTCLGITASLDERLKELFFYSGLASGGLAVVAAVSAILVTLFVFAARHASHLTR